MSHLTQIAELQIKRITVKELIDLWPALMEMEAEALGKAIRNDLDLTPSGYYSLIGKVLHAVIVRMKSVENLKDTEE